MGPDRIPCVVIGCGRTRKRWEGAGENARWICGSHWRHVSRIKKQRMTWALRRWNKLTARGAKDLNTTKALAVSRIWHRTFGAACREAIEAAMGIG